MQKSELRTADEPRTAARLRLLVAYPYVPFPVDRGTYQRTFHLLRQLAKYHDVDFFSLCDEPERMQQQGLFEGFCRRVSFAPFSHGAWPSLWSGLWEARPRSVSRWFAPDADAQLRAFMGDTRYDLVLTCDLAMAQYFVGKFPGLPVVIDRSRVDLAYQLAARRTFNESISSRLSFSENLAKMFFYERWVGRQVALEIVGGQDDATFLAARVDRRIPVMTLVNGFDDGFFDTTQCSEVARDPEPTILFCGAMDYVPNIDALRWFFAEIHPALIRRMSNLRCLIVGRSPVAEVQAYAALPGVTVTGEVPDVRPYYRRAWLQVVPLRIGGGSRLKIPECLAMGTPVISTTIGAQGLDLQDGKHILLADDSQQFVEVTAQALRDPDLRQEIARAGADEVRERLTWQKLGLTLSSRLVTLAREAGQGIGESQHGRPIVPILGIPFDNVTMAEAVQRIAQMVALGTPHQIATANVDFAAKAEQDPELRSILAKAQMVVCDGMPLVWLSRWLKVPLPERVPGSDMVPRLLSEARDHHWKVFFLGGTQKSLENAATAACRRFPGLQLVGAVSPPFVPIDQMDHAGIIRRINQANPDILFVAFGCPKQEKWIAAHLQELNVPVCMGVGASLDFIGGHVRRAPKWMQVTGLEWVFRLLQEPRRLVGRYLVDMAFFAKGSLRQMGYRGRDPRRTTGEDTLKYENGVCVLPSCLNGNGVQNLAGVIENAGFNPEQLVLDCHRVRYVDTTGIGWLCGLHRSLAARDGELLLKDVTPELHRAIIACGFCGVFSEVLTRGDRGTLGETQLKPALTTGGTR